MILIQTLAIFLVPVFIIRYSNFIITKWIGTIGTAYLLGIIVALLVWLSNSNGINISLNKDVGEIGSHVAIAIGIPLLLFGANLLEAKKLSAVVLRSFLSLVISAVIVSSIVYFIFAQHLAYGAEMSGMAIGLYTGGTPNLNAIGRVLEVQIDTINAANLSDMMIGAIFYVFLLIGAKPLLSLFLKESDDTLYIKEELHNISNTDDLQLQDFKVTKGLFKVTGLAFVMALLSALIGIIIWLIKGGIDGRMNDFLVPSLLIGVTVFGIAGSFLRKVRETKGMNVIGQYFILVFSFALASSMDFSNFSSIITDTIILYGTITIGVFIVHGILSYFLKIDADCTIVTLTAGLYGPAFVPAITKQVKNDALTAPGLIVGSIGYAIGTFIGIGLALIFLAI